ncbi:ROK family transcriptional regulator [Paramicrobacterium fandaimingii]|uniref:ROK family transcriptional regulator n=1 Tax=Paramicrobacterium fandaimingii TaxID=2708079 RepID=UPI001AB05003|nr:ROK family transcriptional regulator [Microbacterium fandaimingii]
MPLQWPSLARAERVVLREVLVQGSLPRAEIARRLKLSRATLTRATRTLVNEQLLTEAAIERRSTTGRPSEMLRLETETFRFLGIKLTGDRLFAVVTDLGANVLFSADEPLNTAEVSDVVSQIAAMTLRAEKSYPKLTAIGVCLAGDIVDDDGEPVVMHSAFLGWDGVRLGSLIREATGVACVVQNDVLALTAAEHWFGAGAGLESMALITVGAGIGCGLVVHNELVSGAHGRAGRISHVIVDSGGPICARGHRGCASSYLVNDAIVTSLGGAPLDYDGALERARSGDRAALRAFEDAGTALGALIAHAINIIDPAKVILSGDGLAIYELAAEKVHDALSRNLDVDADLARHVDLDVQPFDFSEWARAGAVLAIKALIS